MARTSFRSIVLNVVTFLLDVAIVAIVSLVIAIVIAGGWEWQVGSRVVSMRSVGNLLIAATLLCLMRSFRPGAPFLVGRSRPSLSMGSLSLDGFRRLDAALDAVTEHGARRVVLAFIATAAVIRILNIIFHFGFITGDDVEIQELTLSALFGRGWPVWDLRSAFFPMTFLFPVQYALASAGVRDTFTLIAAARLTVSAFAAFNIWLVFRAGRRLYGARAEGVLAAGLFAANHLHMTYGGAELPRVVASTFALLAFTVLRGPAAVSVAVGGMLLGVASCLRFGEVVFVVPAILLRLKPRLMHAALLAASIAITMFVILGAADTLYWGDAFHSARAIVDYTLVHGRSSRGFESSVYYFRYVPAWSDFLLCGLAALSFRTTGAAALAWAAIPIVLLSVLPHKEPRYLIVAIPFLALAASATLRLWIRRLASRDVGVVPGRAAMGALALMLALGGSLMFNASKYRFIRSEGAVELAWKLRDAQPSGLVAEQLWRLGGRLYLHDTPVLIDLDPGLPQSGAEFAAAVCREEIAWVALRADRLAEWKLERLRGCGFTERLVMPPT